MQSTIERITESNGATDRHRRVALTAASELTSAADRIKDVAANVEGKTRAVLLGEAGELFGLGDKLRELGGDPSTLEKDVKTHYGILIIPNEMAWKPNSLEDTPPLRAHHLKHPEVIALALRINQHSLHVNNLRWASVVRHAGSNPTNEKYGVLAYHLPVGYRPDVPHADNPLHIEAGIKWTEAVEQRNAINRETMKTAIIPKQWAVITKSMVEYVQ